MKLKHDQVLIIGDSVHTDIIGALIVGSSYIQVATLPHPSRWWEKLLGKWVQIPYPPGEELWEFGNASDYKVYL
jgi:hypothetical protein